MDSFFHLAPEAICCQLKEGSWKTWEAGDQTQGHMGLREACEIHDSQAALGVQERDSQVRLWREDRWPDQEIGS